MGIYDREYYRREGPSYIDMLVPSGMVCKWLIIVNVVVFLAQAVLHGQHSYWIEEWFALSVPKVMEGEVWRVVTYAFLHGDFWHIFWNMLFLWWFGSELEDVYGWREFLCFYLLAATIGGCGYLVHASFDRLTYYAWCVGASGAVTALMVLYAIHFPTRSIWVMMIVRVNIWFFVAFQILRDVAGLFDRDSSVAVSVHLGGAAFAAGYYQLGWRITGLWGDLRAWRRQRSRPRLKIYRPEDQKEPVPVGVSQGVDVDEHLEAKVDAVLEKVARTGQASLTEQERQILLKASEIYKKKRT